jgi:hypothetical protein
MQSSDVCVVHMDRKRVALRRTSLGVWDGILREEGLPCIHVVHPGGHGHGVVILCVTISCCYVAAPKQDRVCVCLYPWYVAARDASSKYFGSLGRPKNVLV